ncbi:Oidioi.mRNA.OKI2018_I69.XSR.g14792.t1.cds [Oikopleura dioica]|uniref:26S proteasome non-ATPase regulatory subunit 9 n=1 Tax=Oikopleura dioica TaxID=34765 RepID=A0ABN7SAW3_OIKDI|nr:Oidioi.mRNA.OKI2018_I69.XSR.g14792.t1.cds [Oikopleura dioica]
MTFEEALKKLMKEKDDLEELLAVHYANAKYDEQLVDAHGFPRADLNIEEIRFARNRFVCAQNDHKDIMKRIEAALHDLHKFKKGPSLPRKFQEVPLETTYKNYKQICYIKVIQPGSPADLAGLMEGDAVLRVENLIEKDYTHAREMMNIIKSKANSSVEFVIRRKFPTEETKIVIVHPKSGTVPVSLAALSPIISQTLPKPKNINK